MNYLGYIKRKNLLAEADIGQKVQGLQLLREGAHLVAASCVSALYTPKCLDEFLIRVNFLYYAHALFSYCSLYRPSIKHSDSRYNDVERFSQLKIRIPIFRNVCL